MPYVQQVAVGRRPHLTVFGNDYPTRDGTGVRDYIHVVDLAKGHVAALREGLFGSGLEVSGGIRWILYDLWQGNCDAFNLGSGQGVSVLEMVAAFGAVCGKDIPYKYG